VEQRVVELPDLLDDDTLALVRQSVNRTVVGERIVDAVDKLAGLPDQFPGQQRALLSMLVAALIEAMSDHRSDERVIVGGTANLARYGEGLNLSIQPLLEALEEHVLLLKILGEASSPSTLTVRIGSEVPHEGFSTTSVVTTGYGPGDEALGTLGVLGPTRMDYPGAMASVRAVAQYLSKILDEG
jgi:heat-inducible transcriptional repressor